MIASAFVTPRRKAGRLVRQQRDFARQSLLYRRDLPGRFIGQPRRAAPGHIGVVAFGSRTLVFREGEAGLYLAYLDSPTNDAS